jgi:hypothetical protein
MDSQLTGSHRKTYDAVLQQPTARNLQWRDVWSMLGALTEAVQEPNGNLKIKRNGQTLVLHRPRGKDLADVKELSQVRHFIERSGIAPPPPAQSGAHLLVVINHHEARVYQAEIRGTLPQRITPYDRDGEGRQLHYVQDDSNGQRKPERKSFYDAVAATLRNAEKVVIFGSGTGASSAMEQLVAQLKHHHAAIAERVIGTVVIDEQHLSENQLLSHAREFYGTLTAPRP